MVLLNEAANLVNPDECTPKVEQETLLSKHRIPVQNLDFHYIGKCKDGKELEKIVQILRSGEEGYYPQLTRVAEERLSIIRPRSALLRKVCPVVSLDCLKQEERDEIRTDMKEWINKVSQSDNKLDLFRNRKLDRTKLPDVRETKTNNIVDKKSTNSKRISATDYSSWDKYDPDTEILKMDLQEENIKKQILNEKSKKRNKKMVQFKDFQTDIEALREANYAKDKGNEFFKEGDYKQASQYYTNSINCKPTAACYTNRALTNIKLKKFKNAVEDCNSALVFEPNNFKAYFRKAQALTSLGKHKEALQSLERAIAIDPNNTSAQELAQKLYKDCEIVFKNTRFAIEELETEQTPVQSKLKQKKTDVNNLIIPIPGTSNMAPPYYIQSQNNNPSKVKEDVFKANTAQTQILHLVTIDSNEVDDDDDGCMINHLPHICTHIGKEHGTKDNKVEQKAEVTTKVVRKETTTLKREAIVHIKDDKKAGGEPFIKESEIEMPDDIHSPYSFLKTWNSANSDRTLEQYALILRSINMDRITQVIGCKLDSAMFSTILQCLTIHFAVPGEIHRLYCILENLVNLDRFEIISLLMSREDRNCVNFLINFLNQHGHSMSPNVINKLLS